jgi:hypothetical protein
MKGTFRAACGVLGAALAVAAGLPARTQAAHYDNAVVYWNEVAVNAFVANSPTATPSASALYVAIVQAAVYDATMAIEQTHQPYASSPTAPAGASVDAAVAAAAHDALVEYLPGQKAQLDATYEAALAEIPDGAAKSDGIRVGQEAAAAMIARRANDGRFAPVPPPPDGDEPGEWRRTSPGAVVTPWTAHVTPFLVHSPEQFRTAGPNPLTSEEYAAQFEETRLYGAKTGSLRTPAQTEIATFWSENTVRQYNRALRGLVGERGLSRAEAARLLAMTSLTAADAMITCWNAKYHYLAWRPVTAIREADTDGNPATVADPAWEPLSVTANHPEYTSGHACLTGAITLSLEKFLGTEAIGLTMDSTASGTGIHYFATVDDLRAEVENARIYGGDHWRKGGSDGTKIGDHVAKWALRKRFFQPQ